MSEQTDSLTTTTQCSDEALESQIVWGTSKRKRRRSNYRAIARRNKAVFLLTMALAVSVILNVVFIFKGGMR